MPSCIRCGNYTKYNNGLCYSCYKNKSKEGKVYFGEVKFANGKRKIYTGQTKRSVYERVGEHLDNQEYGNTRSYTGRGIGFRLLGSIFSKNRFKAERTCKDLTPSEKFRLAKSGAKRFSKNSYWE